MKSHQNLTKFLIMITKQQFTDSCLQEINIIKHLYGKVTPEMLNYRPSEKQRSLLELLQYLAHFAKVEMEALYLGTAIDFPNAMKEAYAMPAEKFLEAMDKEADVIKQSMDKLSDEQLAEPVDLFGRNVLRPRSVWLMNLILKNLVAYKMQLFLYLKACGVHHISTSNLWRGEDSVKS